MDPDGDRGWDGPLGIQIPDDARELERDILAYHREMRSLRRRRALRRLWPGQAGIMPLIASILAVCLIAGMMLAMFASIPAGDQREQVPLPSQPATQHSSQPATQHSSQPATQRPPAVSKAPATNP